MEMFAAGAISLAATTGLARTVLATADRDGMVTVWHTEEDVTITINHDAWATAGDAGAAQENILRRCLTTGVISHDIEQWEKK